jgi:hypothetical protein
MVRRNRTALQSGLIEGRELRVGPSVESTGEKRLYPK